MTFFSKRNNYKVEYSGYEQVSSELRSRLISIFEKYVKFSAGGYGDHLPSFINPTNFSHEVKQEFPERDYIEILQLGFFHEVFSVVEIFLNETSRIHRTQKEKAIIEICKAFYLSGSVYEVNPSELNVKLVSSDELAEEIKQTEKVLQPYADAYKMFFEAVGNLFNRKGKAGDVVRDIYISAENYLKEITGEASYSNSIKKLEKSKAINRDQKGVFDKLHAFRSDTKGTVHAGSSPKVSEKEAVWFLDTMSVQLRNVDIQTKEIKI